MPDIVSKPDDDLERLVAAIRASAKYRSVSPEFIRNLGRRQFALHAGRRPDSEVVVKATRNKLHQAAGAYLSARPRYDTWRQHLAMAAAEGPDSLKRACAGWMAQHASSSERLSILDAFYATTLRDMPPPKRVLDVACGLHPLSIPWMGLPESVEYVACDIYEDMMSFVGDFLRASGTSGQAFACDVLASLPPGPFDLAFVLKTIPCLEQIDPAAGARLLEAVEADRVLVSFPARSLGGRAKGMREHYTRHFTELMRDKPWSWRAYDFDTELAFMVNKRPL
jgi:16S rRNA (guanine(1405)-N(7))-methyltransferase